MNELDEKIKNLAIENWAQFVVLVGRETLICAKARMLRKEGKSYNQIMIKLGMTKSQVRYACQNLSPLLSPDDTTVIKQY